HIRNRQRRLNYGFNVGGPIIRNRSFFFFNFDQFREKTVTNTGLFTVPTDAYRRGDFSSALGAPLTIGGQPARDPLGREVRQNAIYDPRTTRLAPDGSTIRDAFPNNIVPPELFDPVALKIQAMLPNATNGQLINNYIVPGYGNFNHSTIPSVKIDHNFDAKNRISFYYSYNM